MSWISRIVNVFRAGRIDDELDEELRFHLEERTRALVDAGYSAEAATAEAKRRLGNALVLRDQSRDVKVLRWLDALFNDTRFGLRMLRKDALVTSAALLSLALAMGACIAAFALIDALILRPLPVREPDRLVYLTYPRFLESDEGDHRENSSFSYPLF